MALAATIFLDLQKRGLMISDSEPDSLVFTITAAERAAVLTMEGE